MIVAPFNDNYLLWILHTNSSNDDQNANIYMYICFNFLKAKNEISFLFCDYLRDMWRDI